MSRIPRAELALAPAPQCDCANCAFYRHNPKAVEPICGGCDHGIVRDPEPGAPPRAPSSCMYCACAASEWVQRTGACGTCPVRCGSRVDVAQWMADVGGTLRLDDLVLPAAAAPGDLPSCVPVVDLPLGDLGGTLDWPLYGVPLRRALADTGPSENEAAPGDEGAAAVEEAEASPPAAVRPPAAALGGAAPVLLLAWAETELLERLWAERDVLIPALAQAGYDVVVAPAFPVRPELPRAEQMLNVRRSLLLACQLAEEGARVVPSVQWARLEDLDRQIEVLSALSAPAVAVNLAAFQSETEWYGTALSGIALLADALPEVRLLVPVPVRYEHTMQLVGLLGPDRLVLLSSRALAAAGEGIIIDDLQSERRTIGASADLFVRNVENLAAVARRGVERSLVPSFEKILARVEAHFAPSTGVGVAEAGDASPPAEGAAPPAEPDKELPEEPDDSMTSAS